MNAVARCVSGAADALNVTFSLLRVPWTRRATHDASFFSRRPTATSAHAAPSTASCKPPSSTGRSRADRPHVPPPARFCQARLRHRPRRRARATQHEQDGETHHAAGTQGTVVDATGCLGKLRLLHTRHATGEKRSVTLLWQHRYEAVTQVGGRGPVLIFTVTRHLAGQLWLVRRAEDA